MGTAIDESKFVTAKFWYINGQLKPHLPHTDHAHVYPLNPNLCLQHRPSYLYQATKAVCLWWLLVALCSRESVSAWVIAAGGGKEGGKQRHTDWGGGNSFGKWDRKPERLRRVENAEKGKCFERRILQVLERNFKVRSSRWVEEKLSEDLYIKKKNKKIRCKEILTSCDKSTAKTYRGENQQKQRKQV